MLQAKRTEACWRRKRKGAQVCNAVWGVSLGSESCAWLPRDTDGTRCNWQQNTFATASMLRVDSIASGVGQKFARKRTRSSQRSVLNFSAKLKTAQSNWAKPLSHTALQRTLHGVERWLLRAFTTKSYWTCKSVDWRDHCREMGSFKSINFPSS